MSRENVEVVQAALAAWNAGDVDTLRELYDPEAIMRAPAGWADPGPFVGRDAVMRQFEGSRAAFDANRLEPISDFRHGADRVLVRVIWQGAGRGPDSNIEWTVVYAIRGSRIREHEFFWDHAEALEAVGLRK